MTIKILLHSFILYFVLGIGNSEICNLPDGGGVGKCIDINKCPEVASLARRARTNMTIARHIRSLRCGARDSFKVCCTDCYTPEGRLGACVPIQECPDLMSYINTNVNYVRNSICATGEANVCCGRVPAAPTNENCESQFSAFPLDPATQCCGIDASGNTRIIGGSATRVDQYPWLVLLEYNNNNKISLLCGGSLISNKYVLTAAHCVPNHRKPVNVRVGEYDITHDGNDCMNVAVGVDDCNLGAKSVPIKRIIQHPEYNQRLNQNDIALIELKNAVEYTDFVRPICLPTADVSDLPISDLEIYVAGWGKFNWNIKQNSRLKQHVKVPLVTMQDCQNTYGQNVTLWSKQLCAGGEEGKDSCNGDSGGPLMVDTVINGVTMITLDGVVSFGPKKCGTKGVPGIYTKVWEYNTWIRRSITP